MRRRRWRRDASPPPPAPPANQAPTIISAAAVSAVENNGGAIYQATATDPEGSALAFSITGGPDAARFTISPGGQLVFASPPNFEKPADSDGNNVYQVQISASDGQAQTSLTLSVTVTNSKEGVAVRRITTGFIEPTAMAWRPRSMGFFVGQKDGNIYNLNGVNGARVLAWRIHVTGPGLLALVVNPQSLPNTFVAMYIENGFLIVQEFERDPLTLLYNPHFRGPVLRIPAPDYEGGGWLGFDTQGHMMIAIGDAGGTGDPTGSAQDDSSFFGKLIRATRNPGTTGPYYLLSQVAKGLHQPVGGSYYSTAFSAGLLLGDRGQAVADEINYLANGASGANYGWPFKEGFQTVRGTPPAGLVDPLVDFPRPVGASVYGLIGGIYAGPPVQSIAGDYVFADRSGEIYTLPVSETGLPGLRAGMERRTADFVPDVGAIDRPVAILSDQEGKLYILDGDGEFFMVDAG